MSRRRRRKLPEQPLELRIDDLSHDGRGVATHGEKRVFVRGALPGERVMARVTGCKRRYDEAEVLEIIEASAHRIAPRCPHFGTCGGCSLQHLDPVRQIESKHNTLQQNLTRIGKVAPLTWWEPLTGPTWGYRRKARLSVRYVHAKERVLVGFRETYGRFVADMQECHVLDPRVACQLGALSSLIFGMEARQSIPQIEVACGDDSCALVFRHLEPLSESDQGSLRDFALASGLAVLLQPSGPDSITALEPRTVELSFRLPAYGLD
ncbi:MAG: TRAM domain-containing protein, partial [Xanthomonadales bacterium]|nr:TRAM domain-containing protein [Xanthomonadales bacterium]